MEARQTVLLDAVLVVLLTLNSQGQEDTYETKSELTDTTWRKIQQLADISRDVETVLQKYKGTTADDCARQLPQQNYRSGLDKKLTFYKSKLDYDDKLLQSDLLRCGSDESCQEECRTRYDQTMDACVSNANVYIPGLKSAALKNLTEFMDSCTKGKQVIKNQKQQVTKETKDQDQDEEQQEVGNQWHW